MYRKLLINDFKKNTWSNVILLMFITLSVAVAISVAILLTQLFTSISSMYRIANPPHFLQLHKGEMSQSNLDKFNSDFSGIDHSQTVTLININGNEITVSNKNEKKASLEECRLDIAFVKQNKQYDVLLDKDRKPLKLNKGQIAVPIILASSFDINIGDTLTLANGEMKKEYKVSSYVYDGQMNSTLTSSTRFLISDPDFQDLLGESYEKEYMIETWFSDKEQASDYQNLYEESSLNLPKNGQAVTYTMIFLLSALTDIFISLIFSLTGILLIVISFICLRYSVLADLEEDMREIGTMKAIGIPKSGICNLYLIKIKIIAFVGSIFGLLIALLSSIMINKHLSGTFGNQKLEVINILFTVLIVVIIYFMIVVFSKRILKRLTKVNIVDLLVTEKGFNNKERSTHRIGKSRLFSFDFLVSLHKIRHGYGIVFILMLIVSFFIMLPYRAVQTMGHNEFVTYMGSSEYDLLVEVEQGEDIETKNNRANNILQNNKMVKEIDTLRIVRLQGTSENGEILGLHVGIGKNAGRGLKYLSGGFPNKDNEIALSYLAADELKKDVGDNVEIVDGSKSKKFVVSGIYQDVTSGGKTAKTTYPFLRAPSVKYSYGIELTGDDASRIADDLRKNLGSGYSIKDMSEFLNQTLGNVTSQIRRAGYTVFIIGISLSCLIMMLFIKLLLTREGCDLALKKTIGIPLSSIKKQELYPILCVGSVGSFCGVFLAELFGEQLISGIFTILRMGLKEFIFVDIPIWQFAVLPLILTSVLGFVGMCMLRQIKKIDVMNYIND